MQYEEISPCVTLDEQTHKQNKQVVTRGYRARVTTIEGQNVFAPTLCFNFM